MRIQALNILVMKHWPVGQPVLGTQGYPKDPAEGLEMLAIPIQPYSFNIDSAMTYRFSFLTTVSWAPTFALQSLTNTYRQLISVSYRLSTIKAVGLLSVP